MENPNVAKLSPGNALLKIILFSALLLTFFCTQALGQGNLLIFPKRIIFDDGKKYQSVNLTNTGKDTAKYNISFVQIRMNENGSFETIETPDSNQLFADSYVRFFPHSVILGPNESQVVKIQLINPNMAAGEYRSHLYFRAVPLQDPLGEETIPQDTTGITVRLTAIFGITIPVIIRSGESDAKVTLSDLSFEKVNDTVPVINLEFDRTGNMSVYGDIAVDYTSPQGKIIRVGQIQGFAVYTPGMIRRCKIELKNLAGVDYSKGKLNVIYSAQSSAKNVLLAEKELSL